MDITLMNIARTLVWNIMNMGHFISVYNCLVEIMPHAYPHTLQHAPESTAQTGLYMAHLHD